jgi:hypothetical protein
MPVLSFATPRDDLPDYFGEALHQTGEACFEALENRRYEVFNQLFRFYFVGALQMMQRLQQQLQGQQPMAAIPWLKGPITDLLDLSGYALAFAELDGDPAPWRTVRETWDIHLATPEGQNLVLIVEALLGGGIVGMSPRDLIRTWSQRFGDRLAQLPGRSRADIFDEERDVEHQSPLIRELAGAGTFGTQGSDIFIARYLMRHPAGEGRDFERRRWAIERLARLDPLGSEQ